MVVSRDEGALRGCRAGPGDGPDGDSTDRGARGGSLVRKAPDVEAPATRGVPFSRSLSIRRPNPLSCKGLRAEIKLNLGVAT